MNEAYPLENEKYIYRTLLRTFSIYARRK